MNNIEIDTKEIILKFIINYIENHGYSPSVREICNGAYLSSTCTDQHRLKDMMDIGIIEIDAKRNPTLHSSSWISICKNRELI